jgi:lipopolysaccharide transport system ATP-binding protein
MKPIIEIQNISKKFRLDHKGVAYLSLRDKLTSMFERNIKEDFWALEDVSFNVQPGEALGIIGRNGAGKSTLLKILSRITPPTRGKIISRGRIASLLEVGTGFHSELTGRENIFMNGSILGMKKNEINNKFDEIVGFSGTEKFLDTQLKHYSSGMQLRLAFAVAAHLEPEILIIDEVLAVGDAEFQRKCMSKMNDVVSKGRTLLLVSHNLESIAAMCSRGVLLERGRVALNGPIQQVLSKYQQAITTDSEISVGDRNDRIGNGILKFKQIYVADHNGLEISTIFTGQSCQFVIEFENHSKREARFQLDIGVTTIFDEKVAWFSTSLMKDDIRLDQRTSQASLHVKDFPLMPGTYRLTLFCKCDSDIADWVSNAIQIQVDAGDFFGSGKLINKEWGNFLIHHHFTFK